jgi:hypothetical protein
VRYCDGPGALDAIINLVSSFDHRSKGTPALDSSVSEGTRDYIH